jgi:phosphatidylinositol alpha-1,6-mannosyltransferase
VTGRAVILTPGITGTDGIAEVSRMVVRALAPCRPALDVVSLADPAGSEVAAAPGVRVFGAGGVPLRWGARTLRVAFDDPAPSDVICLHLHLAAVGWLLASARRARLHVFLHGIEAWRRLAIVERLVLARAGTIIANSAHTARRFREANPALAPLPIQICLLGVAELDVAVSPSEARAGDDLPFALIVGRMVAEERYKGHDLLLDVWPRVMAEVPAAQLVVAGDGDDRKRLQARAAALGDRVRFTGRVSREALTALYRRCAFFVMPSLGEGFGLVFVEAMRAGKACIGGAGAAAEIISDGVTGLVVDPRSPADVVAAVVRLFREPATRERMGRAGAARAASEFTEARFAHRLRSVLGWAGSTA